MPFAAGVPVSNQPAKVFAATGHPPCGSLGIDCCAYATRQTGKVNKNMSTATMTELSLDTNLGFRKEKHCERAMIQPPPRTASPEVFAQTRPVYSCCCG